MKKLFSILFLSVFIGIHAQTQMPIGPHTSQFTFWTRGYHFTSPTAFNMCALHIPQDASVGTLQSIWVVRFNTGAPPAFPGTTTAYTTLFSVTNVAANTTVACNVAINPGDVIGIYGSRGPSCANSYDGANFVTNINGLPTTLIRSGTQNCINGIAAPTFPIWSESVGSIGRIFMYYNCCPTPTITAAASPSAICAGASVAILGGGATTYTWAPGGQQTSSITVTPTVSTTYTLSGSTAGCTGTQTVAVNVGSTPNFSVAVPNNTVCSGSSITASVAFQSNLTGTPCSTIGVAPPCNNPTQHTLGNGLGTNASFAYPSPYAKWWNDCHSQYLYTAAELTAMGVTPGNITSIGFNVTNLNGCGSFPNYTIRMKCTNATSATAFDMTGLSTVFVAPNLTPVNGWNTHNFSTSYYWDGVSNLLVDICFNGTAWTANASCPFTTTAFTSCVWRFSTSQFVSSCGTTLISGTSANRPNTRFGNCGSPNPTSFSYTWTPATFLAPTNSNTTIITPTTSVGNTSILNYSVIATSTAAFCPNNTTFSLMVVNPAAPTITPINPLCNNGVPTQILVTPTGGTFTSASFANPINTTGIISPSLATIGVNTFSYAVMVGTCSAQSTATYQVSQFNSATITGTVPNLCYSNNPFSLMNIVQSTLTGVWTGPNVIGTYSFNPGANLPSGNYNLVYSTVSTPNATVCPDSKTITANVLNPTPPTITQVGPFCNNNAPVQLSVTPTGGQWVPTPYLSTVTPGLFLPASGIIGPNMVTYIVGTPTCLVQQTRTITLEAYVPAVITGSIVDQCNTNAPASLFPITTNQLGTWSGPGVTNTNFNPSTSGVGSIVLTYSTNSSPIGLCPASASLAVNVFSLANPAVTQVGPFCNTAPPIQIQVSPLGGTFNSFASPGFDILTGVFSPAQANIGVNVISYSVSSGPCSAITSQTIMIEKYVSADLKKLAGPFCKNDSPVSLNASAQNPGGVWTSLSGGSGSSVFTPSLANIGSNNLFLYTTGSNPTFSLCPDTSYMRITVNDVPNVEAIANIIKGCSPVEVTFNTPSTNTGQGAWNFGDGSAIEEGLLVTHTFNSPGTYTVIFSYADEIGCRTNTTVATPINVYEVPAASFLVDPDELSTINPEANFINQTTLLGNNTYLWKMDKLYSTNEVHPKIIFPQAGDYNITLTATNFHGCKSVATKLVTVKNEFGVYIPSSFTPNFDGLNDVFIPIFSPYGLDLKTYSLEIFDRWGEQLFSTKDYTVGWDGSKNNGGEDALKQEVYVYKIRYKDMEGTIHNKMGHVTLMK